MGWALGIALLSVIAFVGVRFGYSRYISGGGVHPEYSYQKVLHSIALAVVVCLTHKQARFGAISYVRCSIILES